MQLEIQQVQFIQARSFSWISFRLNFFHTDSTARAGREEKKKKKKSGNLLLLPLLRLTYWRAINNATQKLWLILHNIRFLVLKYRRWHFLLFLIIHSMCMVQPQPQLKRPQQQKGLEGRVLISNAVDVFPFLHLSQSLICIHSNIFLSNTCQPSKLIFRRKFHTLLHKTFCKILQFA